MLYMIPRCNPFNERPPTLNTHRKKNGLLLIILAACFPSPQESTDSLFSLLEPKPEGYFPLLTRILYWSFSSAGWFCRFGFRADNLPVSVLILRLQCTLLFSSTSSCLHNAHTASQAGAITKKKNLLAHQLVSPMKKKNGRETVGAYSWYERPAALVCMTIDPRIPQRPGRGHVGFSRAR